MAAEAVRGLIEELEAEPSAGRDSVQCQAALLSVGKRLRQALKLPGSAAQVTAYTVMACAVMACIVMACVVVAYVGLAAKVQPAWVRAIHLDDLLPDADPITVADEVGQLWEGLMPQVRETGSDYIWP